MTKDAASKMNAPVSSAMHEPRRTTVPDMITSRVPPNTSHEGQNVPHEVSNLIDEAFSFAHEG